MGNTPADRAGGAIAEGPAAAARRRVLLLRFHALGDVVLTTGVARVLAGRGSGGPAAVEVATEPRYLAVFRGLPWISRLWTREEIERASELPLSEGAEPASPAGGEGAGRRPRFDLVIDLQGTPGSRRLASRLGPRRVVRTRSALRRWVVFWGDRYPRPAVPHAVARYAEAAGLEWRSDPSEHRPVVQATEEERAQAMALAPEAFGCPDRTAVALLCGASRRTKEYPPERLARVGRLLLEAGCPVWWVEEPAEGTPASARSGATGEVGAGVNRASAPAEWPVYRLPLAPLKALLARAACVVTSDSGPMHLASAVGTPVVAIFGSSVPAFGFTPAGPHDRVLAVEDLACRPCGVHGRQSCWLGHWRCLRDLEPVRLVAELLDLASAEGSTVR